jgi:pyrimidine-nucleoside phosphorylase
VLDLSDIPGMKIDKHSTGGVGDKISLALAPLVAACGVKVPMIAGRGLGHTGGTLDKLESIPGFNVRLDIAAFKDVVRNVGCCIIGQTDTLVPADRKLYALRDVTSTIESIPLIASSIMSKKLAEGIDALVLDVKCGTGAFMTDFEKALELAHTMVAIGRALRKKVIAYITRMDQPLGAAVGNTLEVLEILDVLRGRGPADVIELTLTLGAEMLLLAGVERDAGSARGRLTTAIFSGAGLRKFEEMVVAQGGDPAFIGEPDRLPQASAVVDVLSPKDGFMGNVASRDIGRAAMFLGAGRQKVDGTVDHGVGLLIRKRPGDRVAAGEPIAVIHANDSTRIEEARSRILGAMPVVTRPVSVSKLILERVDHV